MPLPHRSARQTPATSDRIAVTGRFQPFHVDHLKLLEEALSRAALVLIGITNPDHRSLQPTAASAHRHLAAANPFSYFERLLFIEAALEHLGVARTRYIITPFPLDEPSTWTAYVPAGTPQLVRIFSDWERDKSHRLAVAYPVIELQGDARRRVSASDIRAAMARGDDAWRRLVPAGTRALLKAMGTTQLRLRCTPSTSATEQA
jgi:nicotinamide-nucleotide adenylyltransferase